MAANLGEISVALKLDEAGFASGLAAARASLAGFEGELNVLSAAGADASAAGMRFAQTFASGLGAGAPQAAASASAAASAAVRAARGGLGGASSAGRSFASGLASGILAGRSGVVSAAASVAQAAAAAARAALEIHSPSRVTEEMGKFFDRGFVRGVEELQPEVERAVRSAVRAEPPAALAHGSGAEAAPAPRASAAAIDYDRLADAMNQRQMVLVMDNRRLAQVQERETARAQSARKRRLALGYGKR